MSTETTLSSSATQALIFETTSNYIIGQSIGGNTYQFWGGYNPYDSNSNPIWVTNPVITTTIPNPNIWPIPDGGNLDSSNIPSSDSNLLSALYRQWLDTFLAQFKNPDFKKSFEIFMKNNPTATPEQIFEAAMRIGYAIGKMDLEFEKNKKGEEVKI